MDSPERQWRPAVGGAEPAGARAWEAGSSLPPASCKAQLQFQNRAPDKAASAPDIDWRDSRE